MFCKADYFGAVSIQKNILSFNGSLARCEGRLLLKMKNLRASSPIPTQANSQKVHVRPLSIVNEPSPLALFMSLEP